MPPIEIKSPQLYRLSYRPAIRKLLRKLSYHLGLAAPCVPVVYPTSSRRGSYHDRPGTEATPLPPPSDPLDALRQQVPGRLPR